MKIVIHNLLNKTETVLYADAKRLLLLLLPMLPLSLYVSVHSDGAQT